MRFFRLCAACALLVLAAASTSFANIAPPQMPNDYNRIREDLTRWHLTIESRKEAREARLQVPRSLLAQITPEGQATGATTTSGFGSTPTHTVVAGVFLSLSLMLAGILVARSRRQQAVGRIAVIAVGCLACAASFAVGALANAGPPRPRALDPDTLIKAVSSGNSISGEIRVEVVGDEGELKLVVPSKSHTRGGDE